MNEISLQLPLNEDDVWSVKLGDAVFLSGIVFTGREGVYRQLMDKGLDPPVDIGSLTNATFHCSPAVSETSLDEYQIPSVTATASFRFAKYMPEFIPRFGIRAVIGKSGMQPEVYKDVFKPNGTLYLTTVGYGLGATYGRGIKRVRDVVWKDELGLAQAMWILEVEHFGPFLVECDADGNSLIDRENRKVNEKLTALYEDLDQPILKRLGEETDPSQEMV